MKQSINGFSLLETDGMQSYTDLDAHVFVEFSGLNEPITSFQASEIQCYRAYIRRHPRGYDVYYGDIAIYFDGARKDIYR